MLFGRSWERDQFLARRGSLGDERLVEIDVEEMFGCGQAGGGFGGVDELGDVEQDGCCCFFYAEAGAIFDAALAEASCEAKRAGEGANMLLLLFAQASEGVIFRFGFGAAMVAHGPR